MISRFFGVGMLQAMNQMGKLTGGITGITANSHFIQFGFESAVLLLLFWCTLISLFIPL